MIPALLKPLQIGDRYTLRDFRSYPRDALIDADRISRENRERVLGRLGRHVDPFSASGTNPQFTRAYAQARVRDPHLTVVDFSVTWLPVLDDSTHDADGLEYLGFVLENSADGRALGTVALYNSATIIPEAPRLTRVTAMIAPGGPPETFVEDTADFVTAFLENDLALADAVDRVRVHELRFPQDNPAQRWYLDEPIPAAALDALDPSRVSVAIAEGRDGRRWLYRVTRNRA